ncbi:MAG: hypothetical protein BM563_03745 [Bacteroidetes bacterium MedPE-SWsnd-G1]|nr:MAG: hypothetical protein BM563_03745 [Bacteroidetes bacterium MedPE-SWsnd-G1]
MENNTVAILLAGGKSERMGVAKGLLKYGKTFWVLEQINRIGKSGIQKVYIGLGYDAEHYFWAIDWFEQATKQFVQFMGVAVKVILNPRPENGSFSTLQTVLNSIDLKTNVILNPIDVPILNQKELPLITRGKNLVTMPSYLGKNGHPIKLDSLFWNSLLNLNLNSDLARLDLQIKNLPSHQITMIPVNDNSITKNLNTPTEWKQFLKDS